MEVEGTSRKSHIDASRKSDLNIAAYISVNRISFAPLFQVPQSVHRLPISEEKGRK